MWPIWLIGLSGPIPTVEFQLAAEHVYGQRQQILTTAPIQYVHRQYRLVCGDIG
jgi:hypothetical protein